MERRVALGNSYEWNNPDSLEENQLIRTVMDDTDLRELILKSIIRRLKTAKFTREEMDPAKRIFNTDERGFGFTDSPEYDLANEKLTELGFSSQLKYKLGIMSRLEFAVIFEKGEKYFEEFL